MIYLDEKGDGRLAYGADLLRDDLQFPEVKVWMDTNGNRLGRLGAGYLFL